MRDIIWNLYQSENIRELQERIGTVRTQDSAARDAACRLEAKVDQLALLCQAMFELLQASSALTDDQLNKKILEIDARNAQTGGRNTSQAKKCEKCGVMTSLRFGRCLFCGHRDAAGPSTPAIS
jgi:hypothetical protein